MEHTKEPFKREPRYVVFKIRDCIDYLSGGQIEFLEHIGGEIASGRCDDDRPPLNAVVVEQDWPEFDLVWEMIEARMTGVGNDARRIVACVNACAGIPTEQLEAIGQLAETGFNLQGLANLRAENAKLREELAAVTKERDEAVTAAQKLSEGQPFDAVVAADIVRRCNDKLAACQRDAERYRYIKEYDVIDATWIDSTVPFIGANDLYLDQALDDAIDAQKKGEK